MLKVLICPDSFKGSLSAEEACHAIACGVKRGLHDANIDLMPLSDGGEGLIDVILTASDGKRVCIDVTGPLGRAVQSCYGIINEETAVIEMATASGLSLVPENERNPLITTTQGVGELILDAYTRGIRKFTIGIGGSATNDGGAGAMAALGARFLDEFGIELPPGGGALDHLAHIDVSAFLVDPGQLDIRIACDVTNPLTGPNGASAVYGPQKGATTEMVSQLDTALVNYARVIRDDLGVDIEMTPGSGAAGGLGGGLVSFLGGRSESGIDIVLDTVEFDRRANATDLIITGEGRVDNQTIQGKVVSGVLKRSQAYSVPVLVLAGAVGTGSEALYDYGATAVMSIAPGPISEVESIGRAAELLSKTAESAVRLFAAGKCSKGSGS